ncbi:rRNA maturation RNase YbeY [Spiroplasma endosymbiont of Cantharis lateralis]|uniref:rRNA maturation RNase YbeY n=1 Tax=Spiroplasma endosymbiont of Cantharis lateralis TaxID=3066277 RepID=UPI00313CD5FF
MKDLLEFNYNTDENLKGYEVLFNKLLKAAKQILDINQSLSFSVNYIDEIKSRQLNMEYREKDYVGDVISFPIDDDFGIYNQLDFKEVGDIFITFSEAKNKASKYKHSIEVEMAWLFVHGLLHILGYDHEISIEDEKVMFDLTDKILDKENIKYKMSF